MITTTIGSKKWCREWELWHANRAQKYFLRGDEEFSWYHLVMAEFWKRQEPWA